MAMRITSDIIPALHYKLKRFGVLLDRLSDAMCDNQGVVKKKILTQCTLGKKHNAVNYHVVREAYTSGILPVGKEDLDTNLDDPLTNVLGWQQRHKIIPFVLYSI